MAAVSLFGDTNMAAVKSCENREYLSGKGYFARFRKIIVMLVVDFNSGITETPKAEC